MQAAPIPGNDAEYLAALHARLILETPPEERFVKIVQFASGEFETMSGFGGRTRRKCISGITHGSCRSRRCVSNQEKNVVSGQDKDGLRPLRIEEDTLVRALLRHVVDSQPLLRQLERAQVRDMDDGGMGSLQFAADAPRSLDTCLVKAEYLDRDGVSASISLDMWKVDFAPLQEYPMLNV